jgi:hypothetical protein
MRVLEPRLLRKIGKKRVRPRHRASSSSQPASKVIKGSAYFGCYRQQRMVRRMDRQTEGNLPQTDIARGHQITPAKPYAFCCGGWSEGQSGRVRTIAGVTKTKVAAGPASAGVGSGSEEVFVMMPAMALPAPGISVRRSSAINWSPQARKRCPQRGSRPSPVTDCRRARSVARIPAAVAAPGRR